MSIKESIERLGLIFKCGDYSHNLESYHGAYNKMKQCEPETRAMNALFNLFGHLRQDMLVQNQVFYVVFDELDRHVEKMKKMMDLMVALEEEEKNSSRKNEMDNDVDAKKRKMDCSKKKKNPSKRVKVESQ